MKHIFKYLFIAGILFSFASCKKDNYAPPGSFLTGRLVYQGDSIQVERNQIPYQLYQFGFGKVGPISGTFEQNGSYSQALFDGNYKLIIPNGQGPFMWKQDANGNPDSVSITMKGDQTVDLEVTPYYMPRNEMASTTGRNIHASFNTEQIIRGANAKNIEFVGVFVNRTQFVSRGDQVASRIYAKDAILDSNKIEFTKFMPFTAQLQNQYFVRLGIKISNVEDMIFTPILKVDLGEIANYKRTEAEDGKLIGNATVDSSGSPIYVKNITAVGDGIDVSINAPASGTYVINIGGGTDINGTTQSVYIDGNIASAKTALYPKQGSKNFDVTEVLFDLSAGDHIVNIRKLATDTGEANIDYIDVFMLKK
jgi:hypothetical protein